MIGCSAWAFEHFCGARIRAVMRLREQCVIDWDNGKITKREAQRRIKKYNKTIENLIKWREKNEPERTGGDEKQSRSSG